MRIIVMETSIIRVENLVNIDEYQLSENIIIQTFNFVHGNNMKIDMNFLMMCSICQDNNTEEEVSRTKCGHIFHKICLINLLEVSEMKTCPICRAAVN